MILYTESEPEAVVARLAQMVAVPKFYWRRPSEPFLGSIRGTHFKVVPVQRTRNSSRPVIVGDIVRVPNGSEIRVRMRLEVFAAAFMAIWLGGLISIAAGLFFHGLKHGFTSGSRGGSPAVGLALVGGMILFGYLMMSISFWVGVKKARALLCDGLRCREAQAKNRLVR